MIKLLPHWVITDVNPAFYDAESKTAIEQTARVYSKMQEIIKDYNSFVDEVNSAINELSVNQDYEKYKECITKLVHDYIAMLDIKVKLQDKRIEDSIVYIKENLSLKITEEIAKMIETGELDTAVLNAVDNLGNRVDSLEISRDNLETLTSELKTKVSTLESTSNDLVERMSVIEESNTNLNNDVTLLKNKTNNYDNRIATLEESSMTFEYNATSEELTLIKKEGE